MSADLQKRNWGSVCTVKLNDCWNKIGVWGNRECGELKKVIHCRNCTVYSSLAAQLFGAELVLLSCKSLGSRKFRRPKMDARQSPQHKARYLTSY
jgi:hypothetical protein